MLEMSRAAVELAAKRANVEIQTDLGAPPVWAVAGPIGNVMIFAVELVDVYTNEIITESLNTGDTDDDRITAGEVVRELANRAHLLTWGQGSKVTIVFRDSVLEDDRS